MISKTLPLMSFLVCFRKNIGLIAKKFHIFAIIFLQFEALVFNFYKIDTWTSRHSQVSASVNLPLITTWLARGINMPCVSLWLAGVDIDAMCQPIKKWHMASHHFSYGKLAKVSNCECPKIQESILHKLKFKASNCKNVKTQVPILQLI